jgi:hypothetical protein
MLPKENFKFDFESQKLQEQQRVLLCCLSLSHTHDSCVRFSLLSSTSNKKTPPTKLFSATTTITHKTRSSYAQTLSLTQVTNSGYK